MSIQSQPWWKTAVFYQIYPRSFMDADGDGIGDLEGIRQKLDYLVRLEIDAIWISPIYPSPMADFGYDVSDYCDIHPMFGNMNDFDRLLEEAHQRGLKIILDWVPNHTSDEHPWFVESRQSRDNPRRDWYIWKDAKPDGSPPNNWESFFAGSAWEWDEATGQYYLHQFLEKQPDLNWRNPEVRRAMYAVLHFWLDKGVDGFRMDVIHHLMKHVDFPDNPILTDDHGCKYQSHFFDIGQPEIHERLREIRQIFDRYPGERVMIGETWFETPQELIPYYGKDLDELHLPFNFTLIPLSWQAKRFKQAIENYTACLPEGASPNFVLGNHDQHRLASRLGVENHRSAALLLLTLKGSPTIYYGDELGMVDGIIPPERYQDPVMIRKPNSEEGRDPERTPMQWDSSHNAGFCPAGVETWLPVNPDYREVNADRQESDPHSTLNLYRRLLALRRAEPALSNGKFAFIEETPEDVLLYTRNTDKQDFLVAINFGAHPRFVELPQPFHGLEIVLSTLPGGGKPGTNGLWLRPHEGVLLRIN